MKSTAEQTRCPAPPRCVRCGRRHRTWVRLAECLLRPVLWAAGRGPWASVSACRPGRTVQLYATRDAAEAAQVTIDQAGCGGGCSRQHRVIDLRRYGA